MHFFVHQNQMSRSRSRDQKLPEMAHLRLRQVSKGRLLEARKRTLVRLGSANAAEGDLGSSFELLGPGAT